MLAKLSAEFIGTFWLVLGGCGSAVLAAAFPEVGIGLVGVSLAFGLTVLTGAYALGPISGAHFNPAVTVGLWAGGRFPAGQVPLYVVAQVIGGILGAVVLYLIANGKAGFTAADGFAARVKALAGAETAVRWSDEAHAYQVRAGDLRTRDEAVVLSTRLQEGGVSGGWIAEEPREPTPGRLRLSETGDEFSAASVVPGGKV